MCEVIVVSVPVDMYKDKNGLVHKTHAAAVRANRIIDGRARPCVVCDGRSQVLSVDGRDLEKCDACDAHGLQWKKTIWDNKEK